MKKYLIISLIIFIVGCSSDEYKIEKGKKCFHSGFLTYFHRCIKRQNIAEELI